MTTIGTLTLAPQPASAVSGLPAGDLPAYAGAVPALLAGASRDAQIADLPETAATVNQLQSLVSASTSASATAVSAIPAPTLPTTQQQTQAQQAAAQPPLKGDFYADGDDAE